jgi:RecB family exonuclease
MTFLHLVVNDLKQRYPDNLSDVTLIFPNRRAGLFFNKYLSENISKPIWAPSVTTINHTMLQLSGLKLADPIMLVAKLYEVYCKVTKTQEPFDDFYFWGEIMLADFDQIDKYLVDARMLFANVKDLKEIEARFDGLTDEQRKALANYLGFADLQSDLKAKYFSIWDRIGDIYNEFTKLLVEQGECYEGLAYRVAVEKAKQGNNVSISNGPLAFIGFNALNSCEKELLNFCKSNCETHFYWDYIPVFEGQSENEAYAFLHENLKQFPNSLSQQILAKSQQKPEITIITSANQASQAKLLPKIFERLEGGAESLDEKTVVILPQENLLIPVLKSLPDISNGINITIGYPLRETPAFGLAELLVRLQINARNDGEGITRFYYRDTIAILNHPYIRVCEPESSKMLAKGIKTKNQIYSEAQSLNISPLFSIVFTKVDGAVALSNYLIAVCKSVAASIKQSSTDENDFSVSINLEFLFALYKSLQRLHTNISALNFEVGAKVFFQLLRKAFMQERVSFTGEPLSGLQVMGFLESRTLDFENLVILSFNDEYLPGRSPNISFIAPSLRLAFGLPNFRHHEAVYAYNFYRLLYRAKKVFLVYSILADVGKSGEMSRYGLQLEMEYLPGEIKRVEVGYSLNLIAGLPITVQKNELVMSDLLKNLNKNNEGVTLSPSGLISYITCPLKFYFRYGLRISETDEISEEVNAIEFGNIIHSTIEELYKPFCGTQIEAKHLKPLLANTKEIEQKVDEAFATHFLKSIRTPKNYQLTGRNMLIRNALLHIVKRIISVDIERTPFTLINHEESIAFPLLVNSSLLNEVSIKGTIDRLEGRDGFYTVIDFKTGNGSNKGKFKELDELFTTESIGKTKEVFQIFCYSLSVKETLNAQSVEPAIWFVRTVMPGDKPQVLQSTSTIQDFSPFANDFKQKLSELVHEIFNSELPFTQTTHTENCKTCPYNGICNR